MTKDGRQINPDALEKLRQTIIGLFADNAFQDVGIRDICKQSGVSPQTVYKYFGDKQELMLACIEEDLAELTRQCEDRYREATTLREAAEALCLGQFEFYAAHPTIARIMFMNLPASYWIERRSDVQTRYQVLLKEFLDRVRTEGRISGAYETTIAQDIVTGAASRIIIRWLTDGAQQDLVSVGQQFCDVLLESWVGDV